MSIGTDVEDVAELVQRVLDNPEVELSREEKVVLAANKLDDLTFQEKVGLVPGLEAEVERLRDELEKHKQERRAVVIAAMYRQQRSYIDIDSYDLDEWVTVVREILELAKKVS